MILFRYVIELLIAVEYSFFNFLIFLFNFCAVNVMVFERVPVIRF